MRKYWILLLALGLSLPLARAQSISTHLYRRVAPQNLQEYMKRETTYWKPWAENEVKKGNLTFWGIFQRIDGENMETEPNVLIINSFKDWDKGADWAGIATQFPNVKMDDIQTATLSTNTDQVFVNNIMTNAIRKPNSVPENDYKYVRIIYHNVNNLGTHLAFEADKWKPLVERAWQEGKTTMMGWGNGTIVLPESSSFDFDSFSYDIFGSLQDALGGGFSSDFSIPDGFFDSLTGNYAAPRNAHLYRIVAVVQAPPAN